MDGKPPERCELCAAARITPWYYEDDVCWVAECEICAVPMVVWRRHGISPSVVETEHMHARLRQAAAQHYGPIWIDDRMRTIADHYHAHGRPEGGFFGRDFAR
jgi:hypothetical protein